MHLKRFTIYIVGFFMQVLPLCMFESCYNDKAKALHTIEELTENRIRLPLNKMDEVRSDNFDKSITNKGSLRLVVYIDSFQCSPCLIDKIFQWNDKIKEADKRKGSLSFIFIVAPKRRQIEDTYLSIKSCGLVVPIYVDTAYAFNEANLFLPKSNVYHTFLIDGRGKILIIGNPLTNDKIDKLMRNFIKDNLKKEIHANNTSKV